MHQINFCWDSPIPRWGSLQRSPDPVAGFKGPTSKGMEGGEGKGEGGEGRGKEKGKGGGKGKGKGGKSVLLALILQFDH